MSSRKAKVKETMGNQLGIWLKLHVLSHYLLE